MTIITQPIVEKKLAKDKQKEPLVGDGSVPVTTASTALDPENGGNPRLLVTLRARRITRLTTSFVLLTALLVITTGLLGGLYLYRQFVEYRLRHFRGWCQIPYYEQSTVRRDFVPQADRGHVFAALKHGEDMNNEDFKRERILAELNKEQESLRRFDDFFNEEFDIDTEFNKYERIEVPEFSHGRPGRFVHDFTLNITGIIDLAEERCFVMPLNRSTVLPPQSLYDLILKMRSGYYDVDTEIVRQQYRVETPAVDVKDFGYYIARECANLPTYRLEQILVPNPVVKRSAEDGKVVFAEFAGKKISEIQIVNLHVAKGNK